MSVFTSLEYVLQTPYVIYTMKIGSTIGKSIGYLVNLLISLLLVILYTVVVEGGRLVFYVWDGAMEYFNCKSLVKYNHTMETNTGLRYTIFMCFSTVSPIFSIYLENIVVSGKENHYVTNPWNSYLFVLNGACIEHTVITDDTEVVREIENAQLSRGSWIYQAKNVYHKFTLKENSNVWVLRLAFKKQHEPGWVEVSGNKIKTL